MNALSLKDLAAKTHRGLRGRVEKGKTGGGLCSGSDVVQRVNGVDERVRGERPKAIVAKLNRDGLPGPNGKVWGDTTMRGQVGRGTGLVNNERCRCAGLGSVPTIARHP